MVAQLVCRELGLKTEDDSEEKPVLWYMQRGDEEWSIMLPNAKILEVCAMGGPPSPAHRPHLPTHPPAAAAPRA